MKDKEGMKNKKLEVKGSKWRIGNRGIRDERREKGWKRMYMLGIGGEQRWESRLRRLEVKKRKRLEKWKEIGGERWRENEK